MEKFSRDKITEIVILKIKNYQLENDKDGFGEITEETKLFGSDAPLDSMELVSLIVEIEEAIQDETGLAIILADEKAMARRTSPFSRVVYLIDYIVELLSENKH
jgi:acyl carrier protein